jgi:hypothetical protein
METQKHPDNFSNSRWGKIYRFSKIGLYLAFSITVLIFAYKTLFPANTFTFFFKTPLASKNTIVAPRNSGGDKYNNGKIKANEGLVFDTPLNEMRSNYSTVKVRLTMKKDAALTPESLTLRKSYRAFFYPEGTPVEKDELLQMINNPQGYFSRSPFFAYGDAVYIIDGGNARPFNSADTFLAFGFSWDDVHPATGDEFTVYKRGKLFTVNDAHPDGTIFITRNSSQYYLIEKGAKRLIENPELLQNHLPFSPIIVDENSLTKKLGCVFQKKFSFFNTIWECEAPIENLSPLAGKNYEFDFPSSQNINLDTAEVTFFRTISWNNLKETLALIRDRIIQNYVQTP